MFGGGLRKDTAGLSADPETFARCDPFPLHHCKENLAMGFDGWGSLRSGRWLWDLIKRVARRALQQVGLQLLARGEGSMGGAQCSVSFQGRLKYMKTK